jgi:thioester reductase-like protein
MNLRELKNLIREATFQALSEITSSDELRNKVTEYLRLSKEANDLTATIKETLSLIDKKEKSASKILKEVDRYMTDFNVTLLEADDWVAEIKDQLKYKNAVLAYKELWEEALTKLNAQTKKVLDEMAAAQLENKAKETIKKLYITPIDKDLNEESVVSTLAATLKGLVKRILTVAKGFKEYKSVVKSLPKIAKPVQEGIEDKKVHTVPKGIKPLSYNKSKRYVR